MGPLRSFSVKWPFEWNTNRASAAVLASVLVVSGAVVAIAGTAPPATLQRYLGDGLLIIDTDAGKLDGQQASSYVHLVPATAVPNARGAVPGTITDVAQGGGGAVITAQANGGNDYYAVSAKTLTPTRLKVTNYERGRKAKGVMVQTGTAPDTDYYYAKRTGSTYVRLVPENSGSRTPKPVRFGSKIEVIGGTDGTLLVAQPGEAKASAVISGRLKAAVNLGTPDPANRLQTTLVDGRPVAVNPATGSVVAFDAGRVAHRSDLPVTGSMRIAAKYETGELVAIVDAPDGPTVVAVQVGTGESRTIPIPADALDGAAPPVVTPDHIYLYTRAEGPGSLRAFDARTGEEADPIDFGGDAGRIPPGAKVEVADGRVVVDVQNSRDAWVIDRPGADGTTKVDKESEDIEDVTKRAVQPPPPPPTTVPGPGAGQGGGNGRGNAARVVSPPTAPTAVSAQPGNRSVVLSWVPADSGGGFLRYEVACAPAARCASSPIPVDGASAGVTVDGLKNGTEYTFTVTALNEVGAASAGPVTATPTGDVPGAPESVKAVPDFTAGTATISWVESPDVGRGLKGFEVLIGGSSVVPASDTSLLPKGAATAHNATTVKLTTWFGKSSTVEVRAIGSDGHVSPSALSDPFVPSAAPTGSVVKSDWAYNLVNVTWSVNWNGSTGDCACAMTVPDLTGKDSATPSLTVTNALGISVTLEQKVERTSWNKSDCSTPQDPAKYVAPGTSVEGSFTPTGSIITRFGLRLGADPRGPWGATISIYANPGGSGLIGSWGTTVSDYGGITITPDQRVEIWRPGTTYYFRATAAPGTGPSGFDGFSAYPGLCGNLAWWAEGLS